MKNVKNIILAMVFLFGMSSMNAIGDPSDCVRSSRSSVIALANEFGWDISSGGDESQFAVDVFLVLYADCLNNN